jgi:hypothetical protein
MAKNIVYAIKNNITWIVKIFAIFQVVRSWYFGFANCVRAPKKALEYR